MEMETDGHGYGLPPYHMLLPPIGRYVLYSVVYTSDLSTNCNSGIGIPSQVYYRMDGFTKVLAPVEDPDF